MIEGRVPNERNPGLGSHVRDDCPRFLDHSWESVNDAVDGGPIATALLVCDVRHCTAKIHRRVSGAVFQRVQGARDN